MTLADDLSAQNQETHDAWEQNAEYWDARIGEGNDFVETLIWPVTQRLLELQPGQRLLDAAPEALLGGHLLDLWPEHRGREAV